MNTELERRIAFSQSRGVNVATAERILERAGGLEAFSAQVAPALREKAAKEALFLESKNIDALFYTGSEYPRRLLECEDAPTMLYRLGHCDLNNRHVIAIVGTRNSTVYGNRVTADLVADLAEKLDRPLIVSGLAYGIDVNAHRAALNCGCPTVAVVAHGLTTIYPAEHRSVAASIVNAGGAIVTEYLSDAAIHRSNFLARNRIVAGLADVTIIVESDIKGGAMVTAGIADAYNRDVGAVPGRVTDRYSSGPNSLIARRKASIIRNADDLIELMNWDCRLAEPARAPELPFVELTEEKAAVINYLRQNPDATTDELVRGLGIPYPAMSARMMEMEMDGLVTMTPGGTFIVTC